MTIVANPSIINKTLLVHQNVLQFNFFQLLLIKAFMLLLTLIFFRNKEEEELVRKRQFIFWHIGHKTQII